MIEPAEEWQLATRRLGRRVLVFDRLPSTNDFAAELAKDLAHDGVAVLAWEQTAGRGQHGRYWQCPPGCGVLLSVIMLPPAALRRPVLLTAWAAVAVCETIRQTTGLDAQIKWPNDILVRSKKVCGILIEQSRGTVAGMGLNVNQSAALLAEAGLPDAGSLACFTKKRLACKKIARALIGRLDEEYDRLVRGEVTGLEARWRERLGLLGRQVELECADRLCRGRLKELSFEVLELGLPGEGLIRVAPENVWHIRLVAAGASL
jgi:BirA family biotin operon repressor/biotin-[acetyl-CoA-carboxylase] ligase